MIISGYYFSNVPNFEFLFSGTGNITNYSSQKMKNNVSSFFNSNSLSLLKESCFEIQTTFSQELPFIGLLFQMETFLYYDYVFPTEIKRNKSVYKNINEWFLNKYKLVISLY